MNTMELLESPDMIDTISENVVSDTSAEIRRAVERFFSIFQSGTRSADLRVDHVIFTTADACLRYIERLEKEERDTFICQLRPLVFLPAGNGRE